MAEVKFEKDGPEWMMFQDLYKLCQKYWITEEDDEYWISIVKEISNFIEKHKKTPFALKVAMSFLIHQENIHEKGGGR